MLFLSYEFSYHSYELVYKIEYKIYYYINHHWNLRHNLMVTSASPKSQLKMSLNRSNHNTHNVDKCLCHIKKNWLKGLNQFFVLWMEGDWIMARIAFCAVHIINPFLAGCSRSIKHTGWKRGCLRENCVN